MLASGQGAQLCAAPSTCPCSSCRLRFARCRDKQKAFEAAYPVMEMLKH